MPRQFSSPCVCACRGFIDLVGSIYRPSKRGANLIGPALVKLPPRVPRRSAIYICALVFVLLPSGRSLNGQTATVTLFGYDQYDFFSNLIQGSDGNLYAVSDNFGGLAGSFGCPDESSNNCTFITRITPDGNVTILHTFEQDGTTAAAPGGYGPNSLIEAPDGNLYGTTTEGGTSNYGIIFKVSPTGTFTPLYTFLADDSGSNPNAPSPGAANGMTPGPLVLGSDGNFYGTSQGIAGGFGFFQLQPNGTFTMLHPPNKAENQYSSPSPLVQASDGNFYMTASGKIVQITAQGGVSLIYTFPSDGSGGENQGVLVEGPDENLYGTSEFSGYNSQSEENGQGIVFKIPLSGAYKQLYKFTGGADGFNTNAELTVGSDGNLYGTTYYGGNTTDCSPRPGCGTVFKVSPSGTFTSLYKFTDKATSPQRPNTRMLQGSDGDFMGSFQPYVADPDNGFKLALVPALNAPVQITFKPATVAANVPTTLTWSVLNAFSKTMQQCHASIRGSGTGASKGAGTWSGLQKGALVGTVFTGSATITPTLQGTYTYVLNCGGIEVGAATLSVGNGPTITTSSLPNAQVSVDYKINLDATGGKPPYFWGAGGSFPPGLSIDNTGVVGGKPTQFGSYDLAIGVQDSSTPPLLNTATLALVVASTLKLGSSLNNGIVGTKYSGVVQATGGFGTYKFVLASGTLPAGLALNQVTGAITGTPTKAGKSTFSITLTDGENPAAKVTQAITLTIGAEPLAIQEGQFPDCTVSVLCEGQFVATGGTPPYTWKIDPGTTFPAGLGLNADGEITGTPIQFQTYTPYDLEVQVTDSATPHVIVTGADQLKIVSGLKIDSIPLPTVTVGVAYQAPPPVASGGLPPYIWQISPQGNNRAVVLDEYGAKKSDGALYSSDPETAGSFPLEYIVTDSEKIAATADQDATLTVVTGSLPSKTVLSSSAPTAQVGVSITLTAKVTSSGGTPTGIVVFSSGNSTLGSAKLNSAGIATFTTSFSTAGTYSITAAYSGDAKSTGSISAPVVETVVTPAATPKLSPGAGTYATSETISITDATSKSTIYYTLNGSTPTTSSTKYGAPFKITKTTTVKAIAVATGYANSAVATATYTIN